MENVLINENDRRIQLLVEKANTFGAAVIFNDVTALKNVENLGINLYALESVKDDYNLRGKSFGFLNLLINPYLRLYLPRFIYVGARKDLSDIALITLCHELGHLIDLGRFESFEEFWYYNQNEPDFDQEIRAWQCGFDFLKENEIEIELLLEEIIAKFKVAIETYQEEWSTYEEDLKAEVVEQIKDYYKEVVING